MSAAMPAADVSPEEIDVRSRPLSGASIGVNQIL